MRIAPPAALVVAVAAVVVSAQTTAPTPPPATQPASAWATRPTPMLTAMLAARSVRMNKPPLRRGIVQSHADTPPFGTDILLSRVAATRAAASRAVASTTRPSPATRPVTVVVDGHRTTTRPALEPTRLKLDIDAATAADAARQLSAALGQNVRTQESGGVTFHGRPGTFAAAVTEFFDTSGLTMADQYSDLTLVRGKPLRVVNLNEIGALVLTRVTLRARRSLTYDSSNAYEYTISGIFVPDPAMGVLGVTASDGVTVTPGAIQRRGSSPNALQNISGFRVNLTFSATTPLKKADTISGRIRGLRTLDVAGADVSFDQIAEGQPVEGDGVTVTVSIPPQMGSASLQVSLKGDKMSAFRDNRWSQNVRQFVRVIDLDGSVMATDIYPEQTDATTTRLAVRSNLRTSEFFDRLTTVRVRIPQTLKALDLPFELKDVELPGD